MKERIEELAREHSVAIAVIKTDAIAGVLQEIITTAVNEALELAARECDREGHPDNTPNWACAANTCAAAIRKLKVE